MNINQRAIEHLERNEYDPALAIFNKVVNECESEIATYFKQLEDDKQEYEVVINKISKGFVPPFKV